MGLINSGAWKKLMVRTAAVVSGALLIAGGINTANHVLAQQVGVFISNPAITEGGVIKFQISQNFGFDIIVDFKTTNGSAEATLDYVSKQANNYFVSLNGASIEVNTIEESIDEIDETFFLEITNVREAKSQKPLSRSSYSGQALIIDNDDPAATPPPATTTPTPPVRPRPTPTPTPMPTPTPTPTPTPEPTDTDEPEVLADTSPTPPPAPPATEEPQRPMFVQSVTDPSEVSTDPIFIVQNILLALLLILLIAFPADMFNSTLLAHYEEITGWFGAGKWLDRSRKRMAKLPSALILGSFAGLAAAIYGFLSPDFGWNRTSFVLFAGMFITMIVVSVIYDAFRSVYLKRRFGIESRLRSQATGLVMASVMVFASRLANFLPGYLYGVFTALIFTRNKEPSEKQDGEGLAVATIILGLVALLAWFAWVPVKELATADNPSLIYQVLDAALASLWVAGLGVIVFGLAPITYFYGETVKAWSNWGWRLIYGTGMVLFVHTVLHPSRGFYGKSDSTTLTAVLTLFIGFAVFSLLFWSYFRYRHLWRHTPDAPTELS